MKNLYILPKVATYRFPPIFRRITLKHRKKFSLYRFYGTSSKPADNLENSKLSFFNLVKSSTYNITPLIWKSIAVASSFFNSANVYFTKSKLKAEKKSSKEIVDFEPCTTNVKSDHSKLVSTENTANEDAKPQKQESKEKKTEEDSGLEQAFMDWLAGVNVHDKKKEFVKKDKKKKVAISKSSLDQRSRFLVHSLADATSGGSQLLRLEEICKHLLLYSEQKTMMCKSGLVKVALHMKLKSPDNAVKVQAQNVLSLVGFTAPPRGQGIRILSIDGGGTRGLMAIEVLRQLEKRTNRKVHELFDLMCGVSSGAILCTMLGGHRLSLDECETLYRKLSDEVFSQSTFWGTGSLVWNHAYYDTTRWINILKNSFGEKLLLDSSEENDSPKIAIISAVMNLSRLRAFIFRNYDFPPRVHSQYLGSCRYRMWEAVHASAAAPGYLEEICIDDYLHQDGGILVNNPTAIAIHEARLLWPSEIIQCVVSLGSGRFVPPEQPSFTSTNLKTKVLKIIDSATDTEAVHIALNDLLSPHTYFRINPYLTEFLTLDENRPEKLDQMKMDAQMYLRRNEYKFTNVTRALCQQRSYRKVFNDWLQVKKALYL